MSSKAYKVTDQTAPYYITITVKDWINVLTKVMYKDIIADSLNFYFNTEKIKLIAWVVMSNHIHFIVHGNGTIRLNDVIRDFKKYTSKAVRNIIVEGRENRKKWLSSLLFGGLNDKKNFQLWQVGYHAINLIGVDVMEKITYIHNNPVKAGLVYDADQYVYSSAIDYSGMGKGVIPVCVL